jgi:hypothetical protein
MIKYSSTKYFYISMLQLKKKMEMNMKRGLFQRANQWEVEAGKEKAKGRI